MAKRYGNITPLLAENITMVMVPIALRYIEIHPEISKDVADAVADICGIVDRHIEDNK